MYNIFSIREGYIINVYERSGIIYLKGFNELLDWCQEDPKDPNIQYCPLNKLTREAFKREVLPYIVNHTCQIKKPVYELIRTFKQNPVEENIPELIEPPGITFTETQNQGVSKLLAHKKFGLFFGTGTGKTLIAISVLLSRHINSAIVATKAKVVNQYKSELDKYIPGNNYIVTSYEMLPHYINQTFECMILDESHMVKNFRSQANENCRKISSRCKYVYLFTGTPQDKRRHEILSQIAVLDPRIMQVKTRIYNRYFRLDDYYQPKSEIRQFSKELTEIINDYTWGKQSKDVFDEIPTKEYIVECNHPPKYYDKLFKDRIIENNDMYCVADSPAKLRLFLREICSGVIHWTPMNNLDSEGNIIPSKEQVFESTKFKPLCKIIHNIPQGIIYYEFTGSLKEIERALLLEHRSYVIVNGHTTPSKTKKAVNAFKSNQVDYIILQSRSGDAGLDFYNANVTIFYAIPESYIVFHQCKSRIARYNQTKECIYYYLLCKDTVEDKFIFNSLKKKQTATDKLFKNYLIKEK